MLSLGMLVPLYASAQETDNQNAVEAQIFTACSQNAIETRDSAIGSARTAYNNAMTIALDERKEAEKTAVALTDTGSKKAAIKSAVEDYKKAVAQAQEALVKARKEAWATFEANMKTCREGKDLISDSASLHAETKVETEDKPIKKSFLESLRNLFKKGE